MKQIDLLLFRGRKDASINFIAYENDNIIFEGPAKMADESKLVTEAEKLERSLVDATARPDRTQLLDFGTRLANALFPGKIKDLVSASANERLRLGICSPDPKLKRIPWEYVNWPNASEPPSQHQTVARIVPVHNGKKAVMPSLKSEALKVCLIVSNPSDRDSVPWDELKELLETTFEKHFSGKRISSRVQLDVIQGASRKQINEVLHRDLKAPYDVIHFIGHGEKNGLQMVRHGTQKSEVVSQEVVQQLFCQSGAQLVILSACNSAKAGANSAISSLAEKLVESQIPAVVGSQMPIPAAAIATFCAPLYQTLLTEGDIDLAVAAGRHALNVELGDGERQVAPIEWGIPVLFRRPGRATLFHCE